MKQGDAAQHRRARPAGEALHDHFGPDAERLLGGGAFDGLGRHRTLPVLGLEAADHLARAAPHRVAVLAKRTELDLTRQLPDLGAGHADAEVAAGESPAPVPPTPP